MEVTIPLTIRLCNICTTGHGGYAWIMATAAAQAPENSSKHWEAEHWWAYLRNAVVGHHFGSAVYQDILVELENATMQEEHMRRIAASGMDESVSVISGKAARLHKSISIEPIADKEDKSLLEAFVPDAELLVEWFKPKLAAKRRADACFDTIWVECADKARHVFKVPSCITYRRCVPGYDAVRAMCC